MRKWLFYVCFFFVLAVIAIQVTTGYFVNHTYYFSMFSSWSNWGWVVWGLLVALVPYYFIFRRKTLSVKSGLFGLFIGLYIFLFGYLAFSGALPGMGFLKLLINTAVMALFISGFVYLATTIGTYLRALVSGGEKALVTFGYVKTYNWVSLIIDFGLGLVAVLLVVYLMNLIGIFNPRITRAIVLLLGWFVYIKRYYVKDYYSGAVQTLKEDWNNIIKAYSDGGIYKKIGIILLIITAILGIWYIFNGYQLAYMPYSTAWDANHAYMFYPKMWSLNNGFYRFEASMDSMPHLRHMFISFWFSLSAPLKGWSGIAPDTVAIVMNFFSGVFVFLLGLGVVRLFIRFIRSLSPKKLLPEKFTTFLMGVGGILWISWLTSGMGAFLVFVDNKTDLGMLTLLLLGFVAGLVALQAFLANNKKKNKQSLMKQSRFLPLMFSGLFFAGGALSKPTALFDLVSFGIFTWWTLFGIISAIGLILLVIAVLVLMEMKGIKTYMPQSWWKYFGIVGGAGFLSVIRKFFKERGYYWRNLQFILLWIVAVVVPIFVIKGAYIIPDALIDKDQTTKQTIQRMLFSQANTNENTNPNSNTISSIAQGGIACSLSTEGLESTDELYEGLEEVGSGRGYNEDIQRYVGYGWKGGSADNQNKPYMGGLVDFLPYGCYGPEPAKTLCQYRNAINTFDQEAFQELLQELQEDTRQYENVKAMIVGIPDNAEASLTEKQKYFSLELRDLRNYYEDRSILVTEEAINTQEGEKYVNALYVPYKYLNFLNMTYNWSIKNSASYYTDIGLHWLILLFGIFVGLLYAIGYKSRALAIVSVTALTSWVLWHLVAGGIIWYNLGVISWTIIGTVAFIYYILYDYSQIEKDKNPQFMKYIVGGILSIIILAILLQTVANMLRIISHGSRLGDVFLGYKSNQFVETTFDDRLQRNQKVVWYDQKDVFSKQFPHYTSFIREANQRNEGEGIWIAGTYIRYFIDNQKNVKYDQLISWIWPYFSDNNACRASLRLEDKSIDYMVLDLNIGTVVQGEGNRSLYDRFLGQINPLSGEIEVDGAITMMTKMIDKGFFRLFFTNNLGTKYAWTLPNQSFQDLTGEELTVFKARMAVPRYAGSSPSTNPFFDTIVNVADQRVQTGMIIDDLADVYGKDVRTQYILEGLNARENIIPTLTQDEKAIVELYMQLQQMRQKDMQQYKQNLGSIVSNSLFSPNQIAIVERVE